MATIHLVTGGCRSGKSGYAQRMAEALPGCRAYVATCPITDDEMAQRIERHRRAREGRGWATIEEQLDLASVLCHHAEFDVLMVDCVTLWISNVMYRVEQAGLDLTEDGIAEGTEEVLDAAAARRGRVIFVTNEVGMGIVPDNAAARRFRDLVGRANQLIAARADAVTLLCAGIPLQLKASN